MRSGQLFVKEIYDLRTNRASSVWLAQFLCSYKEQPCSRETRGQNRYGTVAEGNGNRWKCEICIQAASALGSALPWAMSFALKNDSCFSP